MKSRILSTALALSMLAVAFVAVSTSAAVDYTGSVRTMDNVGNTQAAYFYGDNIYVNVSLLERGVLYDDNFQVQLQRTSGAIVDWFNARTNDPIVGYYNSSTTGVHLHATDWLGFVGPMMVYNIVVVYMVPDPDVVIASQTITIREQGLTLSPEADPAYYPDEDVTITLVTSATTTMFYVQIVNETGATAVNWSRQITTVDGWWSTVWSISSTIPDGRYTLNVRSETTHLLIFGWATETFLVQKYVLQVQPDRATAPPYEAWYLPGETASITYLVYETATLMPYPGVTIAFSSHWLNLSGNDTWLNSTLVGDSGTQSFVIPIDIALYSDVNIVYWANESSRSYEERLTLYTGLLEAKLSVLAGPYAPRDMVVIEVEASVGADKLPGAAVAIKVERNSTDITAYAASSLTTNLVGTVRHTFTLAQDSPADAYIVTSTVSKVGYTVVKKASFVVEWDGELAVKFDKAYYFGGDSATVSFKVMWNNEEIAVPSIGYIISTSNAIIATGNTTGDEVGVSIPADYHGQLTVQAQANHDGWLFMKDASVTVYFAKIALTPANNQYRPGDTLIFNYDVVMGLTSASMVYKVVDSSDLIVATGTPIGMSGSFEYEVPTTDAIVPTHYHGNLTLTTADGSYASSQVTVNIVPNYELKIWIAKSGYTSGEYKPGSTIKVKYSINSYVFEDRPIYRIVLWASGDAISHTYQVTSPTGTLEYKLPSDSPLGTVGMSATLNDGLTGESLSSDSTSFVLNDRLSGWDRSVAGMSASDFTIMVLIIVMILLLIVMPFLKGRMEAPKAPKPEPVPPAPEKPKTP